MNEMVERVAKAIIAVEASVFSGETTAEHYRNCARAAIEAMRKPTDDMRRAGIYRGPLLNDRIENPEAPWERMIDEALK